MRFPFTSSRLFHAAAGLLPVTTIVVAIIIARDRGNEESPATARSIPTRNRAPLELEETSDRGRDNQSEIENAIQWALEENDPSEARAEELLTNLFKTGSYADALEVAQALERGLHRELIPTALEAWAEADSQAAWDAVEMLPPHQVDLRLLVMRHWPDSQLKLLGNLILGMHEGREKSAALGEYIRKLGHSNPAGLSEWLVAHPQDNAVMDQAAEFFVYSCDPENRPPEIAAQWASRITSPERRERAIRSLSHEQDPPSVTNSGLLPAPLEKNHHENPNR